MEATFYLLSLMELGPKIKRIVTLNFLEIYGNYLFYLSLYDHQIVTEDLSLVLLE